MARNTYPVQETRSTLPEVDLLGALDRLHHRARGGSLFACHPREVPIAGLHCTVPRITVPVLTRPILSIPPPTHTQVTLPPYGSTTLTVEYTPNTLDHEEEGVVAVEGELVGRWEYHVSNGHKALRASGRLGREGLERAAEGRDVPSRLRPKAYARACVEASATATDHGRHGLCMLAPPALRRTSLSWWRKLCGT